MSTSDKALESLLKQLHHDQQRANPREPNESTQQNTNALWFADENSFAIITELATYRGSLTIITNRFDIHTNAERLGIGSTFNDVNLSTDHAPFDDIYLRISKEKPVTHHAINQAKQHLKPNGRLHIAGHKNEGTKTYIKKASELFLEKTPLKKNKDAYSTTLSYPNPDANHLDSDNYTQLREVGSYNSKPLYSKPGVFGYNKLDEGSLLLLETLQQENLPPGKDFLDLGCGYGLLTLGAMQWQGKSYAATDNNSAALHAITYNAEKWQQKIEITPADAGKGIDKKFDIILCNPPFHQGFSVSGELTDKFLENTQKLLSKNGVAYFVVNSFIGLEKRASALLNIETLAKEKRFKVIRLEQL